MTMGQQIWWGSLFLAWSNILHIAILAMVVPMLRHVGTLLGSWPSVPRNMAVIVFALMGIVLSHTAQVWGYAAYFHGMGVIGDLNTAIYFSLVTYTSLGYGDVVLGPDFRTFGAFASVTGLLTFGLSTAFLVALMNRLLRAFLHDPGGSEER